MDPHRLFKTLVLGGAMLGASGCSSDGRTTVITDDGREIECCPEECFDAPCPCAGGNCCWLTDRAGCDYECLVDEDSGSR